MIGFRARRVWDKSCARAIVLAAAQNIEATSLGKYVTRRLDGNGSAQVCDGKKIRSDELSCNHFTAVRRYVCVWEMRLVMRPSATQTSPAKMCKTSSLTFWGVRKWNGNHHCRHCRRKKTVFCWYILLIYGVCKWVVWTVSSVDTNEWGETEGRTIPLTWCQLVVSRMGFFNKTSTLSNSVHGFFCSGGSIAGFRKFSKHFNITNSHFVVAGQS